MSGTRWPVGLVLLLMLGGCRHAPVAGPAPARRDTVRVFATSAADTLLPHPDTLAVLLHAAAIRWRVLATGDARALAAADSLPMVSQDPRVLAYARAAPGLEVVPLPWSRVYTMVSDSTVPVAALADSQSAAATRVDLARFSVAQDAIASFTPPPILSALGCNADVARATEVRSRIAYAEGDPVARQVAERLGALGNLRTVALAPREYDWALADGREAGLVLALSTVAAPTRRPFCGARVSALIETRSTLVQRAGR